MAGYQIDPAALRSFAQAAEAQAQQLEQIHQTLAGVQVDGDAFGLLPAAHDLYSAYVSHAQAEVDNTSEAGELLQETGTGLEQTAESYEQTEQAVTEASRSVQSRMDDGRG
jgi:uncharacterized protein YukE